MSKNDLGVNLIARWNRHQQATELPASIVWSDGKVASMEDFKKHQRDTHMFLSGPDGSSEKRMYPNIVADVRFEEDSGVWAVSGEGVTPFTTFLREREAPKCRILSELQGFPIQYRCRIHWPEARSQEGTGANTARGRFIGVNLYWISAFPNNHDWLIYGTTLQKAADFHLARTGSRLNRTQSRMVLRRINLASLEELEPPCYATVEQLKQLGFRTVGSQAGTMAVEFGGEFYVRGNRYTDVPEASSYYEAHAGKLR